MDISVLYMCYPGRSFSLQFVPAPRILFGTPMTPAVFFTALLVAVAVAAVFAIRRATRPSASAYNDLGVVSTRWISELRRDEPWSR